MSGSYIISALRKFECKWQWHVSVCPAFSIFFASVSNSTYIPIRVGRGLLSIPSFPSSLHITGSTGWSLPIMHLATRQRSSNQQIIGVYISGMEMFDNSITEIVETQIIWAFRSSQWRFRAYYSTSPHPSKHFWSTIKNCWKQFSSGS